MHKSLTSQNSVELIDHNTPAAKSHLKTLKIKAPGSDCLTVWGVYLPSNDVQKREVLYQVIIDSMSSENKKASLAGLPLPYNIIAGDMNAALFKQDVQRAKPDTKDAKHQKFIQNLHLQQILINTHIGNINFVIEQTVAKTIESVTYSYQSLCAQRWHPPQRF